MQPALAAPVYAEIVVTADNDKVLADAINTLVADRLVAYGYATTPVQAVYHRDGEVLTETHARGLLHTRGTLVSDVINRLESDHPGTVRSVIATQLVNQRSDYLSWVAPETATNVDHRSAASRRRAEQRDGRRQPVREH